MDTLEDLGRHIEVAEDLQSVVRTMKAISAVGIRRHEAAEWAMRQYLETVEMGLQVALRAGPAATLTPEGGGGDGEVGVVLIGSEIGLCGGFNERLVSFALDRLSAAGIAVGRRRLLIVGSRAEASWGAAGGEPPAHLQQAPATVEALAGTVNSVLTRLDHWRAGGVARLGLFHQQMGGPEGSAPVEVRLLPIDPDWLKRLGARRWPSRRLPVCQGPVGAVTRGLIRQLLFARVFGAVLQSRAAEHAERLTAMQAAERSIGDKIDELRKTHQLLRQQVITAELLDIIGGYEAAARRPGDEGFAGA
ncbi:F0F1 ATP synthase subunit gamma [Antarcticimicrobium luteum]|uniref:F0F1 ATP synthase subunit gamma n=1 Tax=Antarcticimicrobium luteum TaxID=2547397 RepID=A0A4V3AS12_9RHOB|nr:FoF1 ATP synthase subunit gamma [Antarcticimicrobium luteum]TDK48737.1 F0F1 ATP synthase subunit gamma [Antarcticimicrobium luteum]